MTQAPGCPVAEQAAAFDAFDAPYQTDPAEALRWARDQAPVFWSPKLGYWIVARYDDIKAVFRDNRTFSPRIALEKITPVGPAAQAALAGYGYAMNRTLVNEDEPAHMERRRALMDHFLPERLEPLRANVRRLVGARMDAILDRGRADLVEEMLWEVPLTVALEFLGVPEDDMDELRRFSVAHTVNTWGRPSPEEQVAVAHAVGRFWQYAGRVLERMRADPDGPGWMHHAIRQNAVMPDIVTDSYLHSMMMAIIVAAHETTAHASANMLRTLLTHRDAWDAVCRDPALIPNAVEECLRYAGSVVAWRREVMQETRLGGVTLPAGAKLLMVTASGNRDERHFEDGDRFDIYRDAAVDHLTFGYGSHQCMGKNIARIEMRVFLEEITRRLPHLRLAPQDFTYLPNTSFRGPDHLWVEWDPAQNPERRDPGLRQVVRDFAVGAPDRAGIARRVRVAALHREAPDVLGVTLAPLDGARLPRWIAGAHVELCLGQFERKYSLCGAPGDGTYRVAVLREADGRGGSAHLHAALREGMELRLRGPHNLFRLDETAEAYLLIAGGIGITPILAMADRLRALGTRYALHYAGRARGTMAFLDRLGRDHGSALHVHAGDEGARMSLPDLVAGLPSGGQVYACGPARMLEALEDLCAARPEITLRIEHFSSGASAREASGGAGFAVDLMDSGLTVEVPAGTTLLAALRSRGIDLASDCCEGLCGSCEVTVLEGEIEHRDRVLSRAERARGDRMMACCSRGAPGRRLKLAL